MIMKRRSGDCLTLIIDGNNMAYRARHSYDLSHKGVDTSVTFGVVRMLQSLLKMYKPHSCIVCWDGGTPEFRKMLIPQYKMQRQDKEKDPTYHTFVSQLVELHSILPEFGILSVRRRGIEADDLMHQASLLIENDCMIVTMDGDLLQSVSGSCSVLRPNANKDDVLYTYESFEELVGVPVDRFVEYKVLQGDSSDNIPGCVGIGPKRALKIIRGDKIHKNIQARLDVFYLLGYNVAYGCVDLSFDRAGSRYTLVDTEYSRFNNRAATGWCIDNGFTSILEAGSLGAIFGRLRKPVMSYDGVRMPIVWDYYRESADAEEV